MADPGTFLDHIGGQVKQKQNESYSVSKENIDQRKEIYYRTAAMMDEELNAEAEDLIENIRQQQENAITFHNDLIKNLENNVRSMMGVDGDGSTFETFVDMTDVIKARGAEFTKLLKEEVEAIEKNIEKLSDKIGLNYDFSDLSDGQN